MALKARRIGPDPERIPFVSDENGAPLDPQQVLACLEKDIADDIDKAPRGIILGALLGVFGWTVIFLLLVLLIQ